MATAPGNIISPRRASLWLAPVGTTAPATAVVTMPTGWTDVGLFTADSLQWATSPEFTDIRSAQSDYPVRTIQTSDGATLSCDLQEWKNENVIAAFGGGTITEVSVSGTPSGTYRYDPPSLGARIERAAIIQIDDGDTHMRFVFPRVIQKEGVTSDLQQGGEAKLPLRLAVQGGDGVTPFYILSNNPAWAPAP